ASGVRTEPPASWLPWLSSPSVTVYFQDAAGGVFIPVTRHVSSREATPEGSVRQLVEGPRDRLRLAAPFPPGSRLTSFHIQDNVAVADVVAPPSAGAGRVSPTAATQALADTLRGSSLIDRVRLLVNGTEAGDRPARSPNDAGRLIYYTAGPYLAPIPTAAASPRDAMEAYLDGPAPGSGLTGLPADVGLVAYRFDPASEVAYVNLTYTESVQQLALGDPVQLRRTFSGIVATLDQYPGVKAAVLDFQGHARLGLGQCADMLRTPQLMPAVLNDESALAPR
ncbi:MAG: GerMN domain-containing protein, partial [Chloroflexota bacterium]|nr:GerMN domain-containing protein [Chloroflexota bacterium]